MTTAEPMLERVSVVVPTTLSGARDPPTRTLRGPRPCAAARGSTRSDGDAPSSTRAARAQGAELGELLAHTWTSPEGLAFDRHRGNWGPALQIPGATSLTRWPRPRACPAVPTAGGWDLPLRASRLRHLGAIPARRPHGGRVSRLVHSAVRSADLYFFADDDLYERVRSRRRNAGPHYDRPGKSTTSATDAVVARADGTRSKKSVTSQVLDETRAYLVCVIALFPRPGAPTEPGRDRM